MQEDINQEITFRKLSVFMMFMAKGNIARTAEAMKLSSVSVHRALHTLEEGVGCPLFVHKGRNLLPLQAAWTLLEYCQDVISLMTGSWRRQTLQASRDGENAQFTGHTTRDNLKGVPLNRHTLKITKNKSI